MKVLLIPTVAPGFQIFRRRTCSSQANAIYTNGVCCANYSPHDNLLAAEGVAHPTKHGVPSSIMFECSADPTRTRWEKTYPCTLLSFRTFTGARSRQVPWQHIQSSCAYKTKDILLPTGEYAWLRGCFALLGSISTSHALSPARYFVSVVKESRKGTKTMTEKYLCQLETALHAVERLPRLGENAAGA